MRAQLASVLLLLLLAAACKRDDSIIRSESTIAPAAAAAEPAEGPRFVGVWATSAAVCRTAPWRLTPTRLQAPGGLDCRLDGYDGALAGYTANGVCASAGAARPGRIVMTLTPPDSPRALTLSDGPFPSPVSLVRCPSS